MTFEQRLDGMAERQEALAQTVEIIAGMQQRNEEAHRKNEALLAQRIEDKQ